MNWVQIGGWEFRLEDVRALELGRSSAVALKVHLVAGPTVELSTDEAIAFAPLWDAYIPTTTAVPRPSTLEQRLFPDVKG
jgi:hypothetical protein